MGNYKVGKYERKYNISKVSGKEVDPEADYFVLRLDKDPHALVALSAYAQSVRGDNIRLSIDLIQIIKQYNN